MGIGKLVVIVFWVTAIFNLFAPLAEPMGRVLHIAAPAMLVMHALECFFFNRRFTAMGKPLSSSDKWMVIVFGGFHLMKLMKQIPELNSGNQSGNNKRA
ncbi:hypothetical protein EOPP23_16105 [Endozoicomonas sp. OPT23]|uniref:DUF1145 domain-containing protein n=1 Tax=Endozoicomonas sp. OPT23 TaxID=2072845 RepID=UPI00129ABD77|nr:DUF1145 domain-containing protein [Endozoicomonas sp. OPT23]MRI34510.1 hypothetical protein [Endozoicomonas sp. OPT23]